MILEEQFMNNNSRSFSSHELLSDDLKDFSHMADIDERLIDPSISNSSLTVKRSKLPFRKVKGVRRETEKIELFLAEKEHLASIKNRFLPLEPCCSRTLIVRLERIDDLIKKYKDKKKSSNSEAVCIDSPRKTNNEAKENAIFTNKVYGENLSQKDILIQHLSSQFESENFSTDNYQVSNLCTSQYPMKELYEYTNNFWNLDCIVCKERFQDQLELHKHATLSHPDMQISFCDICGKPFFGKKSVCHHITTKHQTTPGKSPIKNTESNETIQMPVEKIVDNPSRPLAKKKTFSLNSKTQNNTYMPNELTNSKTNSIFENSIPNSNEIQPNKYSLRHNRSEFHKNLFETVIHHSLNLTDKEKNSRCNRRTTRSELKTLNETNKMISPRKRKTNAAQFIVIDDDIQTHTEKTVASQNEKRRKVKNSSAIVTENELKIATRKKQLNLRSKASRVNQVNVVPENEKFNCSRVKSEEKSTIPLIKTEEQITDWFPEDFASVAIGTGISRQLDLSKEATTPTKKLEKSFNKKLHSATTLGSEIDISNEVPCIDLEQNMDKQVAYSSNYVEESNIISIQEIPKSLTNQKDENLSIIDEIIVIQLKSDAFEMKQSSEVSQDNVICTDLTEKSKSSAHQEVALNCSTETEQGQNEIEKLATSVESLKQNEVELMDEVEYICAVENEKPEVEIIEENSCNNFGNTDSSECVIMELIEDNGRKTPEEDQTEQNICNNFENADSNECIIVEPTENRRETIPKETEQDVAKNIENADSSECIILETTRHIGEKILEKNTVGQNISNNYENTDTSVCAIMESKEERREENFEEEVDHDTSDNIEKPVSEYKGENIPEENQIEQNDTMSNIESEDLVKESESENDASNAPVFDLQPENNLEEHETNSNVSAQQEKNIELNISDKSNNTIKNENGSYVEDSTATVTRGSIKIVDQSILIPPAFSTTWTCTDCSKSFDEYLNLLLHKTEVHRYACTECNKFFDGKSKFLLHMDTLHPIKLRKGLDHAADQARINELMLQAFKMSKPKEPNNNSLKKRKLNTDSKEKSSAKPAKRAKTDTKNKMVIDNLGAEETSSSQPMEENKSDEVNNVVIDASAKSDSSERLPPEPIKKIKKIKKNKRNNDTLIDNIDSQEKLSLESAKANEVNQESNVAMDASGKNNSKKKIPAKPAKTNKKDKNVKKNKTVIANMNSKRMSSSKSSKESKVVQNSNAMMGIFGKTKSKKKTSAKPVKTIRKAKTVRKNKVDSEQKSASDPVIEKISKRSKAIMKTSGKTYSDSQKLQVETAELIEKIDSEQKSASNSMGEECENKINNEKKIVMDVLKKGNLNEKSPIDPMEKTRNTKIDQKHTSVIDDIDSEQESLSQSVEGNKASVESKAAMNASKEFDSKEKSQAKLINKTKSKKTTKATDANKPNSKKKKPPTKSKPDKKSKTVQNNSKKTKKNTSKENAKTNKKKESLKLSKKKSAKEDKGMSTSQNDSTSKNNFETNNSIQKDTEAKRDRPTNSNIISKKKNVDPQSLVKKLAKKSMEDRKTSWMCIKCQKHFLIRHEYILHSFYTHEDMTLISICDKCGEVLTSIESSKNHTCMEVIVWYCQMCSIGFTTGVEFVQHNRVHHVEISVLHTCDACYKTFLIEAMLVKHQEEHDMSNIMLSEITTAITKDKLKKKSVKISSKKTGKSSSTKSEQTVNKNSVKAQRKKKEKTVKKKKSVKMVVKKSTIVRFKKPVKLTGKKLAKVKKPTKVSTKKSAKPPTDKSTNVSKRKSKKSTEESSKGSTEKLSKESTEESLKPLMEESAKVSKDQSKQLSGTSSKEAEKMEKSRKKPKKPTQKSLKALTENLVKPPSAEPVQILFKKPREFGPRSRKYLPAKFHFFNYQTFQSAFVKIQMPCLFCEDVFRTSAGYINHLLRTHHTSGEECQICRTTFVNETMIQHMLAMHAVPSDVNKVTLKPIESLHSLNEDKDKPINMDTDFIIKHIDKKRLFLLCQYHAFDHILKNETFLCPWCKKVMEHPRHYRIHFLTAHDKTCVICNVEFEISQVAALHKSKVHGYVGSYLWFAEIIVRTLVNSKRFGANPKDIMIHMIGDDTPTYKEIMDNLTDGKVITDLNNSKNSCKRSTSVKSHETDNSKYNKIINIDTSNDYRAKNDSSTNCESRATNVPQQNDSRNTNVIPLINDNCSTKDNKNINNLTLRTDAANELCKLNNGNEVEKLI